MISLAAVKTNNRPVKQVDNRTKKGTFKKGASGNPKGRPTKDFALVEYIREEGSKAKGKKNMLQAVVHKVYQEALNGNMTAVNFLADRILGKPAQTLGVKDISDEPIKVFDIDGMED